MRRSLLALTLALLPAVASAAPAPKLVPVPQPSVLAAEEEPSPPLSERRTRERDHKHGPVHQVVLYIPNRALDLLDIVRLRARLGPGLAVSVRVTEAADLFGGAYIALYVGLPGPRGKPLPKLPIGIESRAGVEVSVLDFAADLPYVKPGYGKGEIGVGLHLLLVGVDVGVDALEIADLITGLFFVDLMGDDL